MQAVASLVVNTRSEAEKALRRGARVASLLAGAEAARDTAVVRAGEVNKDRIERLAKERDEITTALANWAQENRNEFAGKQELPLNAGVLVFRVGNPEVKLLPAWTWKKVVKGMIRAGGVLRKWKSWVRIKFEIDKRKILSDFAADQTDKVATKLKSIGLMVAKDETFDVEFRVQAKP